MDHKEDGVNYVDMMYSSFSFFMSMFCLVFNRSPMLFPNGKRQVESTVAFGSVSYDLRHDVCGDGNGKATISYDCEYKSNIRTRNQHDDSMIRNVYRSPIVDINVDLVTESKGYYPVGGCKDMYSEFVVYHKTRCTSLQRSWHETFV